MNNIYYQHIGEKLWARDSVRSIFDEEGNLRQFSAGGFRTWFESITEHEWAQCEESSARHAPQGFQIWGLPVGAEIVISNMVGGDYLLLLESTHFRYVGRIIHRFGTNSKLFSEKMWGEHRFPIIVWLAGKSISYYWDDFVKDFNFDEKYDWKKLHGRTNKIKSERVVGTRFNDAETWYASFPLISNF